MAIITAATSVRHTTSATAIPTRSNSISLAKLAAARVPPQRAAVRSSFHTIFGTSP
ncbi:MAG: hypothetical protein HFH80_15320 [Lachnospiraceae bacterium]|nr:hypothetical protein [Lachnospiraceae bacterium]